MLYKSDDNRMGRLFFPILERVKLKGVKKSRLDGTMIKALPPLRRTRKGLPNSPRSFVYQSRTHK